MASRRDNGAGTIYKRGDKAWVGKIYLGTDQNGKKKFKYLSGKTEAEVKRKIREYNQSDTNETRTRMLLGDYIRYWEKNFKFGTIKNSSYTALDVTISNHILPYVGAIPMERFSSVDVKRLLLQLKEKGYSYSTVKKVYDCLSNMCKHAIMSEDINKNPMLPVKMLAEADFKKKTIRSFTERECAILIEETQRKYRTGTPVYLYGDAYILILNTGLRLGEAIGLQKKDWDQEKHTIHVQRNIQSISRIDGEGNRLTGKQLVSNTTKTYSGDRIIPLNTAATEAIQRLCEQHPESEFIICSSKGDLIPPERLERTFYRLLRNVGIERSGVHALRHTFASMLFSKGIDIKTVSQLLGHASIQITLNTYVHLINNPEYKAVAKLDEIFRC